MDIVFGRKKLLDGKGPFDDNVFKNRPAISRKVVGKNVHATIPKGNMGYYQFIVPDTVAVEPTFVAFL